MQYVNVSEIFFLHCRYTDINCLLLRRSHFCSFGGNARFHSLLLGEGGRTAAELDAPRGRASHPAQHGEALPHAQECQRGNQARLADFLE